MARVLSSTYPRICWANRTGPRILDRIAHRGKATGPVGWPIGIGQTSLSLDLPVVQKATAELCAVGQSRGERRWGQTRPRDF
jgi:hypothetical protein